MDPITGMALLSALGGLASGFNDNKGSMERVPILNEDQQRLLSQMMPHLGRGQESGLNYINQILSNDPEAMRAFEAPYMRQFQQDIVPAISERFAGMGTGGTLSSSGLDQSLGQAGRELSENLASLRANLKQNALGSLQGLTSQAMRPTFETVYHQPQAGYLGGLLGGLGQGAGQMMGYQMMNGSPSGSGAGGKNMFNWLNS